MSETKVRIITDSASDMDAAAREGLTILPMTITFGEEEFRDGEDLSHREFYERLVESGELPHTSQITPYAFEEAFRQAVEAGEQVVAVTMSSKLSGTWQSAVAAAQEFEGSVFVVDSENVTVGERALVEYALRLREQGTKAENIAEKLEHAKKRIRLVALLNTLEYLKKGGRVSKLAAFAGGLLSIKPVVAVEDGEVVILGKARGSRQGNNLLVERIQQAGGIDFSMPYFLGYTGLSDELLRKYIHDSEALWKENVERLDITTVGGTIGTHAGPGAIAVAFFCGEEEH
ncbi:MAG: DegV family protein [Lachnospiraceae bacterium]|nr:DegV family protein [Lachnospiraceae bacterium]